MKKSIIVFSILLSSPVFNIFAVGGYNIVEIAPSPVQILLEIAKDMSNPEREQFNACKELLNFPENTTEEIFLDIACYISALAKRVQDENIKSEAIDVFYNEVIPKLFAIVQNTQNEKVKARSIYTLTKDQQIRNIYSEDIIILLLKFAKSSIDEELKLFALNMLSCKYSQAATTHRNKFLSVHLALARQAMDENVKSHVLRDLHFFHNSSFTPVLWRDQEAKKANWDELLFMYLDLARNSMNEKVKCNAISKLWSQYNVAYRNEFTSVLFDLAQNTNDKSIKSEALKLLGLTA
ncbi:MAG: hypothetical protein Q8S31_06980 [Alphaproteobacteria bacterium]|nr:hypothetical protein [Alphaproteobacteria bacterium]